MPFPESKIPMAPRVLVSSQLMICLPQQLDEQDGGDGEELIMEDNPRMIEIFSGALNQLEST